MTGFVVKKIDNQEALGSLLKSARQAKGVSLTHAARLTKIPNDYLKALEESCYSELPGDVYAKCYLRSYAQFLGINPEQLITQYCHERRIYKNSKNCFSEVSSPVRRMSRMHFLVTPKILRNAFIALLLLVCLTYLGYKVEAIVKPPFVTVTTPDNDILTSERVMLVSGRTEPEAILTINGEKILIGSNGDFSENVDLQQGVNVIKIIVKKDHSKESVVYRRVVVQEQSEIQ